MIYINIYDIIYVLSMALKLNALLLLFEHMSMPLVWVIETPSVQEKKTHTQHMCSPSASVFGSKQWRQTVQTCSNPFASLLIGS